MTLIQRRRWAAAKKQARSVGVLQGEKPRAPKGPVLRLVAKLRAALAA